MSLTQQQIVDEILTRFSSAWDGTGHMVVYPDVVLTPTQIAIIDGATTLQPWARVTVRSNLRNQKTFGSGPDTRIYETIGMCFVEVFTPTGNGLTTAYGLAEIVRNAFEGFSSPSSIWYRNIRLQENGSEGLWSRINVIIEWQAEERK